MTADNLTRAQCYHRRGSVVQVLPRRAKPQAKYAAEESRLVGAGKSPPVALFKFANQWERFGNYPLPRIPRYRMVGCTEALGAVVLVRGRLSVDVLRPHRKC
jgi:hypothetical protein